MYMLVALQRQRKSASMVDYVVNAKAGQCFGSTAYQQTCHLIAVTIFWLHGLLNGRFQEVSDSNAFSFPAVDKEDVRSVGGSSLR